MNRTDFFNKIKSLGEFRCERDLRKFNNQAKNNPHMNVNLYLGHFGHCKNNSYHHCEFELKTKPIGIVIYYYKTVEREGEKFRVRGGRPFKTAGRGRPPAKNKKR